MKVVLLVCGNSFLRTYISKSDSFPVSSDSEVDQNKRDAVKLTKGSLYTDVSNYSDT